MNLEGRFRPSRNTVFREVGGEFVLLNLVSGEYVGLDHVGGRIWDLIQGQPLTLNELSDIILSEYQVDRDTLAKDLYAFFADLMAHGLIEPAS